MYHGIPCAPCDPRKLSLIDQTQSHKSILSHAHTESKSKSNRVIKLVNVDSWDHKVIYNPKESIIHQIQENKDYVGKFLDHRFTEPWINDLIVQIDCDSVPDYSSPYTLRLSLRVPGTSFYEPVTFRLLNGEKFYTSTFHGIQGVDEFLQCIHGINVSYVDAMYQRQRFDAEVLMWNLQKMGLDNGTESMSQ